MEACFEKFPFPSKTLNSLEKNPKIVTKHCLKTDDPEKFNKIVIEFLEA